MIGNFQKVNDLIATGAQPSVEAFNSLKEDNYEVVINLSPESTPNFLSAEEQHVSEAGMDYIYFPVDCSVLKPEQYEGFKEKMNSVKGKKTFIHCGGNVKSSGFYYIYQVKEEGISKEDALINLRELNVHDKKWYDYFEAMGC